MQEPEQENSKNQEAEDNDAMAKLQDMFSLDWIGEAVPLSEQDGFEHGQQGIGGTAAVVSEVTGSLTIQRCSCARFARR